MHHFFATCQGGLEEPLLREMIELGAQDAAIGFKGVSGRFDDFAGVCLGNYKSRLASRILLPLASFVCASPKDLYRETAAFDFAPFFATAHTLFVNVTGTNRAFSNSLYAAQVVKDAICDRLREARAGWRPSVDKEHPDVVLNLHFEGARAHLSFDSSGEPLYRRGWRAFQGVAPLNESLAAGLLAIGGYTGQEPLFDPCCGSGTLLIEAAMVASRTPAGYYRRSFGFFHHPEFSKARWIGLKEREDAQRRPLPSSIQGLDVDAKRIAECRRNIERAGFQGAVEAVCGDFRDFEPALSSKWLFANPPHGRRLGDTAQLADLYRSLGDFMKRKLAKPAKAFVFTSSLALSKQIGLKPQKRHVLSASDRDCRLVAFDIF